MTGDLPYRVHDISFHQDAISKILHRPRGFSCFEDEYSTCQTTFQGNYGVGWYMSRVVPKGITAALWAWIGETLGADQLSEIRNGRSGAGAARARERAEFEAVSAQAEREQALLHARFLAGEDVRHVPGFNPDWCE